MKIQGYTQKYEVEVIKTRYHVNGNFAITLNYYDDEFQCWMPYENLTVNLDEKLPDNYGYVDINNIPSAEEFINENHLGESTGKYGFSGFCRYPLYKFY